MQDTPDISSVVNMILQNPELIAKISAMAKGDGAREDTTESVESAAPVPPEHTGNAMGEKRLHRAKLASAMKPYLSKERAQAIDTMLGIADILELTRGRS